MKSPFRLLRKKSVLPAFWPAFGFTILYLSFVVLIPLGALAWKTQELGWSDFLHAAFSKRALASYKISFGAAFVAALINLPTGLILAWVLVRYKFPFRRILDALIDLPFALPTAVAGIALTSLYAENGWIGKLFVPIGIKIAYTPIGITLAMVFVGLPFIVRSVQPVLEELDPDMEEAASTLGAGWFTVFRKVVLPTLWPSLLTGFALTFARAVGEYGSVVFIAGNMPMKTEIAPLLIITQLEQYNYSAATAIGMVMLGFSFIALLALNIIQWRTRNHYGQE